MAAPTTTLIDGPGASDQLARVIGEYDADRVLVVASAGTLRRAAPLLRWDVPHVRVFSGFRSNPDLEQVLRGCAVRDAHRPELVVGVGGGSAMDVAKMVRCLPGERAPALDALRGRADLHEHSGVPLVLVPTTAGTGSEVTQFATVFADGIKHSLDRPEVRATVSVIDPDLTRTCPWEVSVSCAFDALAHALESYWSVHSTPRSRALAAEAASGIARVLGTASRSLTVADRHDLSRLATVAGHAIDITRTTVGHAFAYPLTARFGVPHGLAALLGLSWLLPAGVEAAAEPHLCRDPRGPGFLAARLDEMAGFLGAPDPGGLGPALRELIVRAGFPPELGAYGPTAGDVPAILGDVLRSSRSSNTPVALPPDTAARLAACL
ncbi:phosphonoacetaldehyde reductase [Streptomyces tagetis]|uniref:Phosphonoacetaldehyde reductase n=1 Tax=Streptomyces tagetis TaxID=2820809 RepID=A0A940XBN5_9ACTN|nr:phosphonoacetaldehyde reductase [Streptomyces sp. RG38]MBQ0825166.1 phosphonoacetaldehyde reductase [Streptomyces sp. RG38]